MNNNISHKIYKIRVINALTFITLVLYNITLHRRERTMLKLLKNLKKTWGSVVMIVILLCVQAWADLTLPDYTSKIVNTGIQAGGIEEISPNVIRASQMENLLIFTKKDEIILQSYQLLSRQNLDESTYEKEQQKYPILETQDIYVLQDITKQKRDDLNTIMAKPFMIVNMLQQDEMAKMIKNQILENMPEEQKALIANMSVIEIIKNMPEENINELLQSIEKTIDEKLGNMVDQVVIAAIQEEYKQIGMNTGDIQNRYIIKIGFQMLGIALISMISAISIMFLSSKVAAYLGKTLRDKVFKKVLEFSRRRI